MCQITSDLRCIYLFEGSNANSISCMGSTVKKVRWYHFSGVDKFQLKVDNISEIISGIFLLKIIIYYLLLLD